MALYKFVFDCFDFDVEEVATLNNVD